MDSEFLQQQPFLEGLARERKRAERSRRSSVLMLLKSESFRGTHPSESPRVWRALSNATRDTDLIGWYESGFTIGVLFTEIGAHPPESVIGTLSKKMEILVRDSIGNREFEESTLTFHVYPENPRRAGQSSLVNAAR